jgi:hypothetical protein
LQAVAKPQEPRGQNPIDLGWRVLSSTRTTALLALLFSCTAFIAAIVPQGAEALALAKDQAATRIHTLAAWGITDIFVSPFFYAIVALLSGNLLAIAISSLFASARPLVRVEPPQGAPLDREITAPFPEQAHEIVREALLGRLGQPIAQTVQGARVVMLFETGSAGEVAPLFAHLGLMLLVLGAGLFAATQGEQKGVAHAKLAITDSRTRATGHFDMVAGEPFQLFQYPSRYVLRDYVPSREGLGPAVRLERTAQGAQQASDFWVYLSAPPGFDERHRRGEVFIEGRWMGLSPLPGQGLADSPLGVMMIVGLALIGVGTVKSRHPRGKIWVETSGDKVHLFGQPQVPGDADFASAFDRWALHTQAALAD